MERLTARNKTSPKEAYYPYCFQNDTCDGQGPSDKCDKCPLPYHICETLADYEDTGLTPEQIRELKERDTAKIVNLIPFDGCDDDSDITYKAYCPICKRYIGILFKKGYKGKGDNFCRNCGQRLKWEE